MTFNGFITNDRLFITKDGKKILNDIKLRLNFPHARDSILEFIPKDITKTDNSLCVSFTRNPARDWIPEADTVSLTLKEKNGVLTFYTDFNCNPNPGYHNYTFSGFKSAFIDFTVPETSDGSMILHTLNPFWINCDFRPLKDVTYPIDCVNAKLGDKHLNILPVYSSDVACEIRETGLVINTRVPSKLQIKAAVMSVAVENSPYISNHKNITALKENGIINCQLSAERTYPERLKGFGWCTWNAFYLDVTEDKILSKMEEFKAMNIIPRWVLIDDGWSLYKDGKLMSYKEDFAKFPNGLKSLSEKIKAYGVKYVGVWHAITGYWDGVDDNSEMVKANPENFFKAPCGLTFPGPTKEKIFAFWDGWYTYLAQNGIDFVKTDNQASVLTKFDNIYSGATGTKNAAEALDEAALKHFDGAIINCMGSTLENMVCRPLSAISRNSDDFYPNKTEDFSLHTIQNVYTASLQREIHNCDFDMFFSKHKTGVGSAVIRAISGGPVYVSDELGSTDKEVLSHLCDSHGNLYMFDSIAVPTLDCFYTDCERSSVPLKAFNVSGKNIAVGFFGVTPDKTVKGLFKLSDLPEHTDRYLVHDYFSDSYAYLDNDSEIKLISDYNGYGLLTLYPIDKYDNVTIGDKQFYAEAATPPKMTISYKELISASPLK